VHFFIFWNPESRIIVLWSQVNLAVALNKPIIPLFMENMTWPPPGGMGPIFIEYIRFFQRPGEETNDKRYWPAPSFTELLRQLRDTIAPDISVITAGKQSIVDRYGVCTLSNRISYYWPQVSRRRVEFWAAWNLDDVSSKIISCFYFPVICDLAFEVCSIFVGPLIISPDRLVPVKTNC